jgi:hypothetical protein
LSEFFFIPKIRLEGQRCFSARIATEFAHGHAEAA